MKKLLIILSLGICSPAYSTEQTEQTSIPVVSENNKKPENIIKEIRGDIIKGLIWCCPTVLFYFLTKKLYFQAQAYMDLYNNRLLQNNNEIVSDPIFMPDENGNLIQFNTISVPDEYREAQRNFRRQSFLIRRKAVLCKLATFGCAIGVLWYSAHIAYKLIKHAISKNYNEDVELNEEASLEIQTA